ncbi:MAG: hypothetical protein M3083_19855 [Actinomycetota bacterium]|nr:hypothetical protein [Actinomycetota bacterium]
MARSACWANDAACASTEDGSQFASWFDATRLRPEDFERYVSVPPLNRLYAIVTEAQARARAWTQFAAALEMRARQEASTRNTSSESLR